MRGAARTVMGGIFGRPDLVADKGGDMLERSDSGERLGRDWPNQSMYNNSNHHDGWRQQSVQLESVDNAQ